MAKPKSVPRQLSRRDFLKLSGVASLSWLLSACSPTPAPTPTAPLTSTHTPLPTNTPTLAITPTAVPTGTPTPTPKPTIPLQGVLYPDESLIRDGFKKFGLTSQRVGPMDLIYEQRPNLNATNKTPIVFARDPATKTIILATRSDLTMKGLRWYVAGLRDLADAIGIKVGTSVDGSEDWENPKYRSAATDNFNILAPAGSYLVSVLNQWGPRMATDFAKLAADNDMTICLGAFAYPVGYPSELKNATNEQVKQFLQQRIRQILGFVHKV